MKNRRPALRHSRASLRQTCTLQAVCRALDDLSSPKLAQGWDNVGLLAGELRAPIRSVLLCIDLTPAVVDEAITREVQLVVAYHPPIFKPIARLVSPAPGAEAGVLRCIAAGIAIYSTHTALDAADGGTNDVIAEACGLREVKPLEFSDPGPRDCKLVVFVPPDAADRVAEAMFAAGAGRIGAYEKCSFRIPGTGTFFGTETTNPAVGRAGWLETVEELRVEAVCPAGQVAEVIAALRGAHPYEEPAFDVYPLQSPPLAGIGRIGMLPRPRPLRQFARGLRRTLDAPLTAIVGDPDRRVHRAIIVAGAASTLPFKAALGSDDVIVTGEIRHHDALSIDRAGASAVALSHWASERPVLRSFAERLKTALPTIEVHLSTADRDPFQRA